MVLGCESWKAKRIWQEDQQGSEAFFRELDIWILTWQSERFKRRTGQKRKKTEFRKRFNFTRENNSSVGVTLIYTYRLIEYSPPINQTSTHMFNKPLISFLQQALFQVLGKKKRTRLLQGFPYQEDEYWLDGHTTNLETHLKSL